MVPVLCIYEYADSLGWHQDSVMIHVAASSQILPLLGATIIERQITGKWGRPKAPKAWRLVLYRPKNGLKEFDCRN